MNTSIHRLSAIVFTDIVGYTALMGENEELALKTLTKNKEIHEKYFLKYHSTYHKQIGDGFLAIFDSVLEATYAAGFIQDECKKNKIPIRTGIHQGEVVFKVEDVFGDEVNITSRIENAAEKGSIYVSENVKKILVNKTGISIEFVKECTLKNVKDPINLYKVEVDLNLIPSFSSSNQEHITQGIIKKRWFKIGISVLLLGLFSFNKKALIFQRNPLQYYLFRITVMIRPWITWVMVLPIISYYTSQKSRILQSLQGRRLSGLKNLVNRQMR